MNRVRALTAVFALLTAATISCSSDESPTSPGTPDATPPTVVSTNPANNATGRPVSTTVSATFSEPIAAASVTAGTFLLTAGGAVWAWPDSVDS